MIIKARAHPSSENFKLLLRNGTLHIYLKEPPTGNRANLALIRKLTGIFGSCRIVRGARSKNKLLELPVASKKDLKKCLK